MSGCRLRWNCLTQKSGPNRFWPPLCDSFPLQARTPRATLGSNQCCPHSSKRRERHGPERQATFTSRRLSQARSSSRVRRPVRLFEADCGFGATGRSLSACHRGRAFRLRKPDPTARVGPLRVRQRQIPGIPPVGRVPGRTVARLPRPQAPDAGPGKRGRSCGDRQLIGSPFGSQFPFIHHPEHQENFSTNPLRFGRGAGPAGRAGRAS